MLQDLKYAAVQEQAQRGGSLASGRAGIQKVRRITRNQVQSFQDQSEQSVTSVLSCQVGEERESI